MGNKSDKQKDAWLRQQTEQQNRLFNQYLTQANTKSPLELAEEKEKTDWMDTTSGKNGPFDVRNLTAMSPYLQLYNNAAQERNSERMGSGLFQLGTSSGAGANPEHMANLNSLMNERRRERAGGALENAYAQTDARIRGGVPGLLALQTGRSQNLAGLTGNMAQNTLGAWANFRTQPSFLQQLALSGVQGASSAVARSFGGG